ncbi:MAG: hypothetical protein WCD44_02930, partial [Candidatus Babeliales bacterium]
KHLYFLLIRQFLFFLGVTLLQMTTICSSQEQKITIDERIEELKRRNVPPENIANNLVEKFQYLGGKINLTPEDKKKIAELTEKLRNLTAQTSDTFTQSEAQLSLKKIRELIAHNYNIYPYLNVIFSSFAKEGELKKTHYVFYHAQDNVWRIPRDLYRKLYERLDPLSKKIKDFEFLRWNLPSKEIGAQQFVVEGLKRFGLINDTKREAKVFLLSTNLALFGNVGNSSECSWDYFVKQPSHRKLKADDLKDILNTFGVDQKYIQQVLNLSQLLRTKENTLLQIFIPKDIVDYVSYVAYASGIPADKQTIEWILQNIKQRKKYKKPHKYMNSFMEITKEFKTAQKENPLFKELLERAEKGDFNVSDILEIYCNTPWEIENINYLQARLVFSNKILMTPDIGIKIFRYDAISREKLNQYEEKLTAIVNQMVEELLNKVKNKNNK